MIIAICWLLSFIIGLTPMLGWNRKDFAAENSSLCTPPMIECLFENVVTMDYMVYYNFFACVLVPLLLMLGIYLRIFMAARRQLKQTELKVTCGERSRSTLQREVHAAKSLAIIVGLFAICWLPLHIINCFTLFCKACSRPPLLLMYFAILFSHANSVVNPLIYAYRIREFRQTFRKILRQHIFGRAQSSRTRTASSKSLTYGADAVLGTNRTSFNGCTEINGSTCKLKEAWHQNGYSTGEKVDRTTIQESENQQTEKLILS